MIIVSDTSPISNLLAIGRLDILEKLYSEVIVPPKVFSEITELERFGVKMAVFENADWIKTVRPTDNEALFELRSMVDAGEAEAIALALELKADLLIDERLGSRVAQEKGISPIGLLGVLLIAKEKGIIEKIKPALDDLRSKGGFWLGQKLVDHVLMLAKEL